MHLISLVLFSLIWLIIIYEFNILLAGRPIKLNLGKATLYITTMAAIGLLGEVLYDTVYNSIFGRPLWVYHLYPIHHGYTSIFSLCLWGAVGLYIYMLHGTLKKNRITSRLVIAAIFCIDAIIFEVLINLSYKVLFKDYLFYYLPNDLWHITSLQTLPLYLLAGFATLYTFDYASSRQKAAITGSVLVAIFILGTGILLKR